MLQCTTTSSLIFLLSLPINDCGAEILSLPSGAFVEYSFRAIFIADVGYSKGKSGPGKADSDSPKVAHEAWYSLFLNMLVKFPIQLPARTAGSVQGTPSQTVTADDKHG